MKVLLIALFILLNNCTSHQKNSSPHLTCISEAELSEKRKEYGAFINQLSQKEPHEFKEKWESLRDECWKKSFKIDDVYVFLYRDQKSKKIVGKLSSDVWVKAPKHCLNTALKDILNLDIKYSKNIIEASKKRYGSLWGDRDVGASSWVNCAEQKQRTPAYYNSLDTLMHELKHEAGNWGSNCSFYPWKNRRDCIKKPKSDDSLKNLGIRKNWKGIKKKNKSNLSSTQSMYLNNAKRSGDALLLIDELRSYTVGLEHMEATLKKHGKKAIYAKKQKRSLQTPLIAVYDLVSRYRFSRLKIDSSFEKSNLNHWMFNSLKKAENSLNHWHILEDDLGIKSSKASIIEKNAWKLVQKL